MKTHKEAAFMSKQEMSQRVKPLSVLMGTCQGLKDTQNCVLVFQKLKNSPTDKIVI